MEQRFSDSISEIKLILNVINDENEARRKQILDYDIFPRRALVDNCYTIQRPNVVKIRVVLCDSPFLARNISRVLEPLIMPFVVHIDSGCIMVTPKMEPYPYHASLNSRIDVETRTISDVMDLKKFMSQLGWHFDSSDKKQDNSVFIQKSIDNQDRRFGLISDSKFSFARLAYVELYIHSTSMLVKQWEEVDE